MLMGDLSCHVVVSHDLVVAALEHPVLAAPADTELLPGLMTIFCLNDSARAANGSLSAAAD